MTEQNFQKAIILQKSIKAAEDNKKDLESQLEIAEKPNTDIMRIDIRCSGYNHSSFISKSSFIEFVYGQIKKAEKRIEQLTEEFNKL